MMPCRLKTTQRSQRALTDARTFIISLLCCAPPHPSLEREAKGLGDTPRPPARGSAPCTPGGAPPHLILGREEIGLEEHPRPRQEAPPPALPVSARRTVKSPRRATRYTLPPDAP